MKFLLYALDIELFTDPDLASIIFIREKLNTEKTNHHKPAKDIAILDASSVSIPSKSGPNRIMTKDIISCVPPPKYPSA